MERSEIRDGLLPHSADAQCGLGIAICHLVAAIALGAGESGSRSGGAPLPDGAQLITIVMGHQASAYILAGGHHETPAPTIPSSGDGCRRSVDPLAKRMVEDLSDAAGAVDRRVSAVPRGGPR